MNRILVVEDEEPIAELIRMSLKNAGYQCEVCYDGEELSLIHISEPTRR